MMAALVRKVPKEMTPERGRFGEEVNPFLAALSPRLEAGCLANLPAQFPYFLPREDPRESLAHRRRRQEAIPAESPVHVELRHAFRYKPVVLDFLGEHDIGFVNAYLPRLPGPPPLHTSCATTPIGSVCFHGRDAAQWWEHKDASERYDHAYSREELVEWVPHPRDIVGRTRLTFINNCRPGKSAKDAIRVVDLLGRPLLEGRFAREGEKKLFT